MSWTARVIVVDVREGNLCCSAAIGGRNTETKQEEKKRKRIKLFLPEEVSAAALASCILLLARRLSPLVQALHIIDRVEGGREERKDESMTKIKLALQDQSRNNPNKKDKEGD